jgi:hypothetical protein
MINIRSTHVVVSIDMPVTVAAPSKGWTVFALSDAGSWFRIPLKAWMFGMFMFLFCVCVILCLGTGLATG